MSLSQVSQLSSQKAIFPETSIGLEIFLQSQLLQSGGLQIERRFWVGFFYTEFIFQIWKLHDLPALTASQGLWLKPARTNWQRSSAGCSTSPWLLSHHSHLSEDLNHHSHPQIVWYRQPQCLQSYSPHICSYKVFERIVSQHIRDGLPPSLDWYQFAYRANRSTEDAVTITLHRVLSHLENRKIYVRKLFVDYSLPFNTITSDFLTTKLDHLEIPPATCSWIKDFLTNQPQPLQLTGPD